MKKENKASPPFLLPKLRIILQPNQVLTNLSLSPLPLTRQTAEVSADLTVDTSSLMIPVPSLLPAIITKCLHCARGSW